MKITKRGFTLIELLVVVLIIGILAAVAVPQYQKATQKSRLTQAIIFAKAVHDAQEIYYLSNGEYATAFDKLDISIDCPTGWSCQMNQNQVDISNDNPHTLSILYGFNHRKKYPELSGKLYCSALPSDPQAIQLCESLGGTKLTPEGAEWTGYVLN